MSNASEDRLPDYDAPPVVETILGVQFDRLPGFRNAHAGAFWERLGADKWPTVLEAPPLSPQFEKFDEAGKWGQFGLQFMASQDAPWRTQLKNPSGDRMVQIQNGHLHVNWMKRTDEKYPRYDSVREDFERSLRRFVDFVTFFSLGEFRPNQWEVTYLNHVPRGTVWNTLTDWSFFTPFGSVPSVDGVISGEAFDGHWHFVIPDQKGRLHIQWQHAKTAEANPTEIIVLTFTARGPLDPSKPDIASVLAGVDLGRATIVRAFASLMSEKANRFWGLHHASD